MKSFECRSLNAIEKLEPAKEKIYLYSYCFFLQFVSDSRAASPAKHPQREQRSMQKNRGKKVKARKKDTE
jgi:hypothetical protein